MSKNKARYTDEELESIVVENRKALEDWSLQMSKEIGPILNLNKDEADNAIHKMYNALEELLELRMEVKQLNADLKYAYDEARQAYRDGPLRKLLDAAIEEERKTRLDEDEDD